MIKERFHAVPVSNHQEAISALIVGRAILKETDYLNEDTQKPYISLLQLDSWGEPELFDYTDENDHWQDNHEESELIFDFLGDEGQFYSCDRMIAVEDSENPDMMSYTAILFALEKGEAVQLTTRQNSDEEDISILQYNEDGVITVYRDYNVGSGHWEPETIIRVCEFLEGVDKMKVVQPIVLD